MKKLAIRLVLMGVVGAAAAAVPLVPAHAAQAQPCRADGMYMYGRYPVYHNQDIYQCAPDPFSPRWYYSETCPAGTHPKATLTPYNGSNYVYMASTECVAN